MAEFFTPPDDDPPWGYIRLDGTFFALPKVPLLQAGLGPPPFDVTLPGGQVRRIVYKPEDPS